jgi:Mg-chelatase subunit ChlI
MSYITLDSFGTKTNITNPFCNIAVEISLIRDNVSSRASSPLDLQSLVDEEEQEDQEQKDQEQKDQEQEDQEQEDQEQEDHEQEDHEQEDQDHANLSIDELLDGYDSDDHAIKFGAYYASVN